MSEMIERVARAIAEASGEDPDGPTGSLLNEGQLIWQEYEVPARAAIEAMRDLPNDVHKAMCDAYNSPTSIWMAGINAALGK